MLNAFINNRRTDREMDRQTDSFAISISRVSMLTRDKNRPILMKFLYTAAFFEVDEP